MKFEMKTQNFLSLVAVVFACVVASFGQSVERISKTPVVSEVKSELKNAVLWEFQNSGEWKINTSKPTGLEIRQVTLGNKTYVVLVRQTWEVDYKYPETRIGAYVYEGNRYYLFDRSKLEKIIAEKPEFNKAYAVDLEADLMAKGRQTEDAAVIGGDIYRFYSILKIPNNDYEKDVLFGVFPVIHENKQKVRFRFYERLSAYSQKQFDPKYFNLEYFEVSFDDFLKFINEAIQKTKPENLQNKIESDDIPFVGSVIDSATYKVNPKYPKEAKRAKISGVVKIEVLIDESGKVVSAIGVSGEPLLVEAAIEAAKQWRFEPEIVKQGVFGKVRGVLSFNFAL